MYRCVQQASATDDPCCREGARLIFRCKQGWRQRDGSRMLLQLIAANFVYLAVKTVPFSSSSFSLPRIVVWMVKFRELLIGRKKV